MKARAGRWASGERGRWKRACVALVCASMAGLLSGCSSVYVYRLTKDTYPPKASDEDVKLFMNKVQRPYKQIAFIDSQPLPDKTEAARNKQYIQIRAKARELGADAVHEIRFLDERVQGIVADQRVPLGAYKQGRYKLYFVRGTAILYTNEESQPETTTPTPTATESFEETPEETPSAEITEPSPSPEY